MLPPECVIDSPQATIEMVSVVPKGTPPFAVAVSKVHVVARPSGVPDAPVPVEVKGALQFSGLAQIDEYAPKWTQVLSKGMVRAGRGSRMLSGAAKGALLEGTLAMDAGVVLIPRVRIACGFLEIPSGPSDVPFTDGEGWFVSNGEDPVDFWSQPGKGERLSVWPGGVFHRVETRGGFTHVVMDLKDGSALHGWVDASLVNETEGIGGFAAAGLGCGMSFHPHQIIGPAIVRAGTKVSVEPGREPWAFVPRAVKVTVHYFPGPTRADDTAAIEEAPGLTSEPGCPGLANAFIPADSFTWTKD